MNIAYANGWTPLCRACDNNHPKIVKLLLEREECDISCVRTRHLGIFNFFKVDCSPEIKKLILGKLSANKMRDYKKFDYELIPLMHKVKDE